MKDIYWEQNSFMKDFAKEQISLLKEFNLGAMIIAKDIKREQM